MPTLLRQEPSSCHYASTPLNDIRPSSSAAASLGLFRSSMAVDDPALNVPPVPQYLALLRQSSADTIREERTAASSTALSLSSPSYSVDGDSLSG